MRTLAREATRDIAPRSRRASLLMRALSGDPEAALYWLERHGETAPPELRIAVFRAAAPKPPVTLR
jgi:hypothetical protein